MRFILSSLATAALALVPFAAPTAITREVTTDLPARFAMYLVTAEPRANGLRVQYANCYLHIHLHHTQFYDAVDGVFLGGRGRIALDRTVHIHPDINAPEQWGDWNVVVFSDVQQVAVKSEEVLAGLGQWHAVVGEFVQNSEGMLRLVGADGGLKNGLKICGDTLGYTFWWDDVPYLECPVAEIRVVPL